MTVEPCRFTELCESFIAPDGRGLSRLLRRLSPLFIYLLFLLFFIFLWSFAKKLVSGYFLVIRCCKKVLVEVITLSSFHFVVWNTLPLLFPVDVVAAHALNTLISFHVSPWNLLFGWTGRFCELSHVHAFFPLPWSIWLCLFIQPQS